ncbi:class I SAM-dependent methyltransferase [Streptomyces sp. NPDC048603]|uniref:class I SAM-dependent methyltransferase n=1 Tax=Streptomyces sp. NPDC048603 TaxID=3365577 RepID=UPI0037141EBD
MTEPSPHLAATADAYDAVAGLYAELFRDALDARPLDRAMLAAFAELVRGSGTGTGTNAGSGTGSEAGPAAGPVAELGCGPGAVTAYLRDLGLDVFGLDLSPVMIGIARAAHPDLRFEVGSMDALDALDVADGTLRGIVCWYSVIHTPPHELPAYFAEFRRVLAPDGHLLLAFFESEGDPVTEFDHKVLTAYRWPVDGLAGLAAAAGFTEVGRMLRAPCDGERFHHGRLLMRKDGEAG